MRRKTAALIAVLTVSGAALRLPGLNSSLWFDEIVTLVESVRLPVVQVVTAFPGNNHHPFYSLLAHLSVSLLGEYPWTLRLPAYVFGVVTVPLMYWFGIRVTSRAEALLATLLLVVSYHHVWFSQNARGYTMLLAFTLLASGLLVQLLEAPRTRIAVWYGLVAGLGIYTHLTMAFVVGAHVLVWLWTAARAEELRRQQLRVAALALGATAVMSGVLYLPMVGEVYDFFTGPPQGTAAVATSRWAVLEALRGMQIGFGTLGVAAALALLAIGGLSYLRASVAVTALFVLPGALTGLAMAVLGAPIRPRFFLMLLGFGLLILARGAMVAGRGAQARLSLLQKLDVNALGFAMVGLMAAGSVWSLGFNYQYPKQDFEGALQFIDRHRAADEPVATAGLAIYPFERYHVRPWTPLVNAEQFEEFRRRVGRGWVVYSFPEYMDAALVRGLREHCATERILRGTLGGGDVLVCRVE